MSGALWGHLGEEHEAGFDGKLSKLIGLIILALPVLGVLADIPKYLEIFQFKDQSIHPKNGYLKDKKHQNQT